MSFNIDPALRASSSNNISASNPLSRISPVLPQAQYLPVQSRSAPANIFPGTPQSGSHTTDYEGQGGIDQDGTQDGGPNDQKRPRACEACRGLKVRCEPAPNDPDGPCKRCAKANRNCLITQPSRKRQKKTDSRVAELEKKIDALTASLQAKGGKGVPELGGMNAQSYMPNQQLHNGEYGTPFNGRLETASSEWPAYKPIVPPMVVAGQKRKHVESRDLTTPGTPSSSVSGQGKNSTVPAAYAFHDTITKAALAPQAVKAPQTHEYRDADVIDRGLVTTDMATQMFNWYVEKMAIHMPAVVFPHGTTAAEIRKTRPTLFLAILSASSGMNYPELQRMLTKEVMSIYADRIISNGEKTLEIIQALHVSTLWYWPPEHFEELKFYQLIHIAAVMAIDIGIGKKSKSLKKKNTNSGLWRDHPWRKTPYPDPESIEARRAWLACYFLCCNAAMGLRRLNLIRWTPFMADCLDVLENSPEAAHSDKILCQWVRSQHIAEEVGNQFSMDDPSVSVNIADPKIQYALKGFERDIERWSTQIPPEVQSPALTMTKHIVNLYTHEVAIHAEHNAEPYSGDPNGPRTEPLSPAHIDALSNCLTSIDGAFELFLKFDVETIRCFPVAHFVRVAYVVVVLIKMYFSAAIPNSELGKVINKDNMKVEYYLDGLVSLFKASAAQEKSRSSAKFLMVLIMLKTWFHRQKEHKPSSEKESSNTAPPSRHEAVTDTPNATTHISSHHTAQHLGYSPANTPLQLLSEVATGNSRVQPRPDSANIFSVASNDWPSLNDSLQQTAPGVYTSGMIDPSLSMDAAYTMGDGFEQAMGMTLGGNDFGAYFNDDPFFGSLMDSVGAGPTFEGF